MNGASLPHNVGAEIEMSTKQAIATPSAPAAIGPYSQAILDSASGLIFCSGQIGIDPATGEIVSGGVVAEFEQLGKNVAALLTAAGSSLPQVVKTTLFLADMADFATVNARYAELFSEPFPARSTVAALGLPKGARVELEVIARRG